MTFDRDRRRPTAQQQRLRRLSAAALMIVACTAIVPRVMGDARASADASVVSVAGNQFLVNDVPFVPRGFNSIALLNSQWCTQSYTAAAAAGLTVDELGIAKNIWNANALRFQVSQPVLAGVNGVAYAQQLQAQVHVVLDAGFVVIVSMQDQSRACGNASPLPGPATVTAWTTLLTNTDLGSDPAVMLEVFNEPQSSELTTATTNPRQFTWVDWLSGGRAISPSSGNTWTTYTPVGHQDLVNLIRTTLGATNVLIADGGRHAAHLEGMPMLDDPGSTGQIAYAVHPYYYTVGLSSWDLRWGNLARTNAVIATEWNYTASACGTTAQTMAPQLLSYMRDTINVGILGQSLDSYDDLVTGPSLQPTKCGSAVGGAGADFFSSYMSTFAEPVVLPAPTGLTATPSSSAGLELSWEVPNLTAGTFAGYHVYRNGTLLSTVTTNAFSDATARAGTVYDYSVDVFDTMWRTSVQSDTLAAANVPAAPTIGTPTAADASATVRWTAPAGDGGSPITRYDVRVVDNATGLQVGQLQSVDAPATSAPVTGLTNGTAYRFQVVAVNAVGASAASASSNVVTPVPPATVPGAPTIGTATSGNATATARWTAPSSDGGSAIVRYDVRVVNNATGVQVGPLRTAASSATSLAVTGLANGTAYVFQVVAVNAVGPSAASASSNVVTPVAPATVPGAPTISTASSGNGSATVRWTAPASNGGSAITRYDVRVLNASGVQVGALRAAASSATSLLVTGLTNGTTYRFQVAAVNGVGTSPMSATSNSVTPAVPATVPGAPIIGTPARGTAGGSLTAVAKWSASTSTGGSPITGYRVTTLRMSSTSSSASVLSTTTSAVLGPTVRQLSVTLANGNYRFQVVAINAVGTSAASARSSNIVPR